MEFIWSSWSRASLTTSWSDIKELLTRFSSWMEWSFKHQRKVKSCWWYQQDNKCEMQWWAWSSEKMTYLLVQLECFYIKAHIICNKHEELEWTIWSLSLKLGGMNHMTGANVIKGNAVFWHIWRNNYIHQHLLQWHAGKMFC